jgi:hypothetical protein
MTTKHLQLDPAANLRLAWIAAYCRHALRMSPAQCRPTTIMRRAIDAYAIHLERLMLLPDQHDDPTRDRELAQGVERMRLRDMHGDREIGVPEGIACGVPLRPLSEHVKDATARRAPQANPMDRMRKEIARAGGLRLTRVTRTDDDSLHASNDDEDDDHEICT